MLSSCRCSKEAEVSLRLLLGVEASVSISAVEIEFKELPYFIVSRSRVQWDPAMGDMNIISIVRLTEQGLIADPSVPGDDDEPSTSSQLTFIPWTNIVSLSITRAPEGGKGSAQA